MTINPAFTIKVLTLFVAEEVRKAGFRKAVLGLSGGLDSAVCAALAAAALGPRRVLGLIMPYGGLSTADVHDAEDLGRRLGIRTRTIDIAPQVDAYYARYPTDDRRLRGNKMARERMSILYDVSAREKALILGTSNKTELLLGYGTIHGDMASGINPLGDLYKSQVRQLGVHLDLPKAILEKVPSAGLWPGQTDEGELEMKYADIDAVLHALVDRRLSRAQAVAEGFRARTVDRVIGMIRGSEFKRQTPPIAKISSRSVGHDFLYPYDWGK